jgi:hypothetical protein
VPASEHLIRLHIEALIAEGHLSCRPPFHLSVQFYLLLIAVAILADFGSRVITAT